ncbi:MAG: hypothetical protein HOD85_33905, partial [Deltaproteobacteria bacterium]|nr:hypothetical protein [Deltaproteobacteria bacterium]
SVEAETTANLVVIDKAYAAGDLAAASRLEQHADFANIGELVAVMKRSIPEVKRRNLENWIGDDILAAYEQKILASADPATPSEFQYMQQSTKSHGFLPSFGLPDFPDSEIWVVNPRVLSIYELRGSRRREAKQDMDISSYTDKTYLEMDNVVEDPEPFIIARNLRQLEAYEAS